MSGDADGQVDRLILIGDVAGPFGVRGQVKMVPLMERPETLSKLPFVHVRLANGQEVQCRVTEVRQHGDVALLTFREVTDRNGSDALRGARIFILESQLPPLGPDSYYATQLVGLGVVTDTGRDLGVITAVHFYPANDVYETPVALIPAVGEIVLNVDLGQRLVTVHDIPGLCKDE